MPLPPPEKLKGKILIKDKLIRKKGETGTLQRGASINLDSMQEEPKKGGDVTDSPLPSVPG